MIYYRSLIVFGDNRRMALPPPTNGFPPEAMLYFNQMTEVKHRFVAINRILGAKKGKSRTLSVDTDNEFMWLQIRKIIELVTYSAIASDRERYSALRAQTNCRLEDDQKATKILSRLSGINPKFMPVPLGNIVQQPDGSKHFEGLEEAKQATLNRFTDLFNDASEHLHTPNPYGDDAQTLELTRREGSRARIVEAFDYLKTVLSSHYKMGLEFKSGDDPKALDEFKGGYIVSFKKLEETGVVEMMLFQRKDEVPYPLPSHNDANGKR
jgi:hypothetical protein